MSQSIVKGSSVFVRGKEWDDCDVNEWFSGEVVRAGPKRLSVHFDGETKLCHFERSLIEAYQQEYIGSSWTMKFEKIKAMLTHEHGVAAGDAMEQAFKEIRCSSIDDMVNAFATVFSRELHRRAAVDIITAVMCLDEALR